MTAPGVESAGVRVEVDGAVGRLTLAAPERLNAVDTPMLEALAELIPQLAATRGVRVITLTGAGRGFCAGANLTGQPAGPSVDTSTLYAAGRVVRGLVQSPIPTVALVGGPAAGVGLSLALACDYVLAAESATFSLAFAKIGLMPDGGATALVAASVGRARAMRLSLSAEGISATVAADWGLVSETVPDSYFEERGDAVTAWLAASSPGAVAATKAAVNAASLDLESALSREEDGQELLLAGADFREGVAAFLAKRRPTFLGE